MRKKINELDNFLGVKWSATIENALKIFFAKANAKLTDVTDISGEIAFRFTGLTYFNEATSGVGLGFIKNRFTKGFIVINEASKESAIETFKRLKSKHIKIYGEPDEIAKNLFRWLFDELGSPEGNMLELMIVNENAVCVQYACGSIILSDKELV